MTQPMPAPAQPDLVHSGEAERWGGWKWELSGRDGEHFKRCSHCGSIDPRDLVAEPTWVPEWADMKYGWPHKFYVDIPNRDPERVYVIGTSNSPTPPARQGWIGRNNLNAIEIAVCQRDGYDLNERRAPFVRLGEPDVPEDQWPYALMYLHFGTKPMHHAKFYSVHLADPTLPAEVVEAIEAKTKVHFEWLPNGRVRYSPIVEVKADPKLGKQI